MQRENADLKEEITQLEEDLALVQQGYKEAEAKVASLEAKVRELGARPAPAAVVSQVSDPSRSPPHLHPLPLMMASRGPKTNSGSPSWRLGWQSWRTKAPTEIWPSNTSTQSR